MLIKKAADLRYSDITPKALYLRRREFIQGTAMAAAGALIGAAVGGVAGGLAGKGVAESVNPTEEEAYWRKSYSTRPYAANRTYDDLGPAYRYGWESKVRHADRRWNDVEGDLERGWDKAKANSKLGWHEAKDATRDAWHRVEEALPGDADPTEDSR
jgi:hypothetical protein